MEERHQDAAAATRNAPARCDRTYGLLRKDRNVVQINPGDTSTTTRTPAPTQIHGRYLQQHDSRPRVAKFANTEHAPDLHLRTSVRRAWKCGTHTGTPVHGQDGDHQTRHVAVLEVVMLGRRLDPASSAKQETTVVGTPRAASERSCYEDVA